ncbi:MAG: hypothetical protein NVSMB55_26910 [Mycobacteriales bacterium]
MSAAERIAVVKTAVLKTRPGKDHLELSALHGRWTTEAAGIARQQIRAARSELDQLPRWAVGRRKALTAAIGEHTTTIQACVPAQVRLEDEIDRLYRQVD